MEILPFFHFGTCLLLTFFKLLKLLLKIDFFLLNLIIHHIFRLRIIQLDKHLFIKQQVKSSSFKELYKPDK